MMFRLMKGKRYPWERRVSIYSHIQSHLGSDGRLPHEHNDLPDEDPSAETLRFAPGAQDSILGFRSDSSNSKSLLNKFMKVCQRPTLRIRADIYEVLMKDGALGYIDSLIEEIVQSPRINRKNLYEEALWMATQAAHRTVVKSGISILGLYQTEQNMDVLLTLGKHDEFTLYVAVAIQNRSVHVNDYLFQLAQTVNGWGKIHVVERLEPTSPTIRQWLLEHGCANDIMPQYLACVCARNGDLDTALAAPHISGELYEGTGIIISGLIAGGPAEDIDDYEHGPSVISNYLRHSRAHAKSLVHFNTVSQIRDFLSDGEQWTERFDKGWTTEVKCDCLEVCDEIIAWPLWRDLVHSQIHSAVDSMEHWDAKTAAVSLNIDVWPILFEQLKQNPLRSGLYYDLMRSNERTRIEQLVSFAISNLPLDTIRAGAATLMGVGPGFEPHSCLDFILQDLDSYEGVGGELIVTGLQSPVIRNRHMALRALEGWTIYSWPTGALEELRKMCEADPDQRVRGQATQILTRLNQV